MWSNNGYSNRSSLKFQSCHRILLHRDFAEVSFGPGVHKIPAELAQPPRDQHMMLPCRAGAMPQTHGGQRHEDDGPRKDPIRAATTSAAGHQTDALHVSKERAQFMPRQSIERYLETRLLVHRMSWIKSISG